MKFRHTAIIFSLFAILILMANKGSAQNEKMIDSLKEAVSSSDQLNRIKTLNRLSTAYAKIDSDTSIYYARLAFMESSDEQFWSEQLSALDRLSSAYRKLHQYDLSLAMIDSALIISYAQNSYPDIAYFENIAGTSYIRIGQYPKALLSLKRALEIIEIMGDDHKKAYTLNNLTNTYVRLGLFEEALEVSLQSLKIKEDMGNEISIAMSLLNLGGINTKLENMQRALDNYMRAFEIFQEKDDHLNMGKCLNNMGTIYKKQMDFMEAKEKFAMAVEEYTLANAPENITMVYRSIAGVEIAEGNAGLAYENYLKSLEITKQYKDYSGETLSIAGIGHALFLLGEFPESLVYLKDALAQAIEAGSLELQKDIHHHLSMCYEAMGKKEIALKEFKSYTFLSDSLLNSEKVKHLNEMQIRYETEKKEQEIKILKQQNEIDELQIKEQDNDLRRHKNVILFSLLLFVLIAVISYLLFNRYRLKQLAAKSKAEKKALQLESRMLRSQMNPHFLFNSLNSIQSYISEADTFLAESYLSKFARLVRNILEHSRKNTISLDEDIESLQLFLELEQLRFRGMFDFEILLDDELNNDEFFIPPMLIQPFVENAIIHGLRHKKEKGKLQVDLQLNGDVISCIIKDNGIGRKQSSKINKRREKKSSLGMKVTQERFELLKNQTNPKANMQIFDLQDGSGNSTGTRVLLQIPYEQDI